MLWAWSSHSSPRTGLKIGRSRSSATRPGLLTTRPATTPETTTLMLISVCEEVARDPISSRSALNSASATSSTFGSTPGAVGSGVPTVFIYPPEPVASLAGASSVGRTRTERRPQPLRGDLVRGLSDFDRVVDRIPAPLEPAAVVHGDPLPTQEVGVEPGLACPPAGTAIERNPLVRDDAGLFPVGRDLRVGAHRVVHVAVVLHVVGVRAAVAPHVACDPPGRADVVVAADLADVLVPCPDADESRLFLVGENLLGLVDVDDDLRVQRDLDAERADRRRFTQDCLD